METLRVKLKADLLSLCGTEDGLRECPPPELSQSVMRVAYDAVYNTVRVFRGKYAGVRGGVER